MRKKDANPLKRNATPEKRGEDDGKKIFCSYLAYSAKGLPRVSLRSLEFVLRKGGGGGEKEENRELLPA